METLELRLRMVELAREYPAADVYDLMLVAWNAAIQSATDLAAQTRLSPDGHRYALDLTKAIRTLRSR